MNASLAELDRIAWEMNRELGLPRPRPRLRVRRGPLLPPPGLMRGRPVLVLDRFAFDRNATTRYHDRLIRRLARHVVELLRSNPAPVEVILTGHTDRRGNAAYNQGLGLRRAAAVRARLAAEVARLAPGLAGRVRYVTRSAGATRPIAPGVSPAAAARNRRVDVIIPPRPGFAPSRLREAPGISPKVPRPCCMLAPDAIGNNIADPSALGTHNASNEAVGQVYTDFGGFFDLGHVRDMIDVTKAIYDQIVAAKGAARTSVASAHGTAVLIKTVPAADWMSVARCIAYDDGFAYEIMTYTMMHPGGHNSSFSPEDLFSNALGTLAAERAVAAGGTFDAEATKAIADLLRLLGARTPADTKKAFAAVNKCWIDFNNRFSITNDAYLLRRNFTMSPWLAPGFPVGPMHPSASPGFPPVGGYYDYTHTASRSIPKSTFAAEVATIRADAAKRYGSKYDSPVCP